MTGLRLDDRRASLSSIAIALPLLATLGACAKKPERPTRTPATVSVVPARRATVPYVIEANGIVTPLQTAAVASQVDGIVTSVDFQEGQDVSAGQALFHVDARPYQNAYDQAVAVLARDSASAANASGERDRYQKLLTAKVITPQEAGLQFTTAATTDATVRADRASVANARFNLDNTVIRAPIGGKTGGLLVRRGNLIHAGAGAALVVINQVRPILVRFSIPSSQLGLILQYGSRGGLPVTAVAGGVAPASPSIDSLAAANMDPVQDDASQAGSMRGGSKGNGGGAGDAAGVAGAANAGGGSGGSMGGPGPHTSGQSAGGDAATGRRGGRRGGNVGGSGGAPRNAGASGTAGPVTVDQSTALMGERTTGKLSFIDNAVDTTTGTVQLKAQFDNSNGRLWAGQFATTSLHLFDEENALVVPTQAVVTGQRGNYVYVVDQSDTARQRAVVVERASSGLSIISSGIQEGDRVVTDGQSRLTPDSPVKLRDANDGTGGAPGAGRKGGKGGRKGGGGGGGGATGGGSGGADANAGSGTRGS
ncbi:MAG: efflux RND transporter periplasmic adaptor subunit [Gemmatimonadaceae bacterium]